MGHDEDRGTVAAAWHRLARRLPSGVGRIAERIAGRDLLLEASSLGFYGLVSALPLLTLTFTAVGAIAGEGALRELARQAEENGPAGAGEVVRQVLEQSGTWSWTALLFTLWPATAYGGGLRRALQRSTEGEETAPALRGRATALGMVVALPVLVLAGLPLTGLLTSFGDDGVVGTATGWGLAFLAGAGTLTVVLSLLYRAFSPTRLGWADIVRGAGLTAVVTSVFSIGFVTYLQVGDVEDRFGGATIGLVVLLGVYLYVANALLLAGFEAATHLDDDGAPADGHDDGDAGSQVPPAT